MKRYFLQWRLQKMLRQNTARRRSPDFASVREVGVLFAVSSEDTARQLATFIRNLQKDGKRVSALTFFEEAREAAYSFDYEVFTGAEIDVWGNIRSEKALQFINQPFDYLYCICTDDSPVIDYLLAASKAHCRIGPYREGKEHLYEMMISLQAGDDPGKLIDGALRYTKALVA